MDAARGGSLPSRGVWIEIYFPKRKGVICQKSLPSRGVWIEISPSNGAHQHCMSLPSRGVWIEIDNPALGGKHVPVAPLAGSVD